MYEYKSEALMIHKQSKGLKIVKSITEHIDTEKLDELINSQAAQGWELVTHSSVVDNVIARVNTIVTFRRPK